MSYLQSFTVLLISCCLFACSDPSDTDNANLGDNNLYEIQFIESSILSTDSPPRVMDGKFIKMSGLILDGSLYLGRSNLKFSSNRGNTFNRVEPVNGFNTKIFVPTKASYTLNNKIILTGKKVSESLDIDFNDVFPDGAYMYQGTRTLSGNKEGGSESTSSDIFLLSPEAYSFLKYKGIQI